MEKLSVVVICYNEEERIGNCLDSVRWADEIVVLDSCSEDRTLEVARRYTDRVFQHAWQGFGRQKNLALEHASHPWVLCLDADESLTPALAGEIRSILGGPPQHDGYRMPRRTRYLGRLLRYCWYPDHKLRLFRRGRGRWSEPRIHERVLLDGSVGKLRHPLIHDSFPTLEAHLETLQRYTTLGAQALAETGRTFSVLRMLGSPIALFLKVYVIRGGFLDGLPGLIASVLSGVHEFLKYAKLYERERGGDSGTRGPGAVAHPPRP